MLTTQAASKVARNLDILTKCLVCIETLLVIMALVPAQLWTRLLPQASNPGLDGPFPTLIAPVITTLIYLIPTIIGLLSTSWQQALFYATLPAWIGLGLFVIAATYKVGIFYLVSADHVTANVSILEMFAALGGMGWLARQLIKIR